MRAILMVLVLPVAMAAQRAPCTGSFVDLDGRPIAAATVTFVQEPSQTVGGDPDRVEVATDGNGHFAGELLLGSPYVVWAIGPCDPSGKSLVSGIAMSVAGGKEIALVAERRAAPSRIDLRGVTAWRAHLPPALRVLVGAGYALGPDRPLPGDGVFKVEPWPEDCAVLALVDDKLQVVCYSEPVAFVEPNAMPPVVEFWRPRTIGCEALDEGGEAAASVDIEVLIAPPKWWLTAPDPLPGLFLSPRRHVGRTDARCAADRRTGTQRPWSPMQTPRRSATRRRRPWRHASTCATNRGLLTKQQEAIPLGRFDQAARGGFVRNIAFRDQERRESRRRPCSG